MVEPGGPPCPRRQHILIKALDKNTPPAEDGVTMKSPSHDDEPNRPARQGKIRETPMIAAMDPFRVGLASRTLARSARGTNGDHQTGPIAAWAVYNKASGNHGRRFERLLHDVDSFRRTNPSLRPNCIKSESDGIFGLPPHPRQLVEVLRFRLMINVVSVEAATSIRLRNAA